MAAAVSGRSKYLNSTIQIFSVSCFCFRANHPPTSLWQQQSAWPCGQCQQTARPWWASALMTRWLVSFSFLRKRLCNFISIIICFERFLDDFKKKKMRGQLNCFYYFFPQITIWCSCSHGWQKRDKMDHLLPPLGVGSGRETEKLQAWGTWSSASPFQGLCGSKCTFSLYWEFSLKLPFFFVHCEKSLASREEPGR